MTRAAGPSSLAEAGSAAGPRSAARAARATVDSGALVFARYAYPPNALGHCGPDGADQLLEQVSAGADDHDLRTILRGFAGAWPYLELIAGSAGVSDPLDARVVRAYWIGNELLDGVPINALGRSFEDRFRPRVSRAGWDALARAVASGPVPHHSAHVLLVYPWVGMLRSGSTAEPMRVLDGCRIRWGQVVEVSGGGALVRSQPLTWDGRSLRLGPPRLEHARVGAAGAALVPDLAPGDWCALHWDWVCDRLDSRGLAALRRWTAHSLALVNAQPVPAPAPLLS